MVDGNVWMTSFSGNVYTIEDRRSLEHRIGERGGQVLQEHVGLNAPRIPIPAAPDKLASISAKHTC